eukprot:CAMPEP_0204597402 /NCGR_PEP_ID=MMETSP0661-20131031/53786_1 /ASSEMBLY_ACC=CAM_ASM_000606 /TAXON_ID=109239 /ORGANISM="Alexandrium margalefi, Strain AMGDE01CS-322" /LENGTH=124 /DNA_ID=CAMNT_0051608099 /DNA_START=123 /DNA_END=497 /DNA_ORIENTATION=-
MAQQERQSAPGHCLTPGGSAPGPSACYHPPPCCMATQRHTRPQNASAQGCAMLTSTQVAGKAPGTPPRNNDQLQNQCAASRQGTLPHHHRRITRLLCSATAGYKIPRRTAPQTPSYRVAACLAH